MTSGVVTSITPKRLGDSLVADASAGATVLPVGNAGDFSEDFDTPRFLVIGESMTPLEYVAVDNDDAATQQTVTLAAPLATSQEVGLPVTLWDGEADSIDKRAIVHLARVRLDDQEVQASVEVTVPHTVVPFAGMYSLIGARVELAEGEAGEWEVAAILGRPVEVEGSYVTNPSAFGHLETAQSVPDATFTVVKGFTLYDVRGVEYDDTTGLFTFTETGMYDIRFGVGFEPNATGTRACRPRFYPLAGASYPARPVRVVPPSGNPACFENNQVRRCVPGESVSFEVLQNSGGALLLEGIVNGATFTTVSILRVAP